jgi:hypothetical protein
MWIEAIEDAASSEDMAGLNDGDIKRIDARIAAASALLQDQIADNLRETIASEIARLKPKGWRRAAHVLREIGPLAAIIGIVVALLAITLGALYQAFSHVKEEAEFRTNTRNQLEGFTAQFIGLRALISANQPQNPQNQTAAKLVLAEARQRSFKLPVDVVEQAGGRFVEAAAEAPQTQAWSVALDYVSYRSSLNSEARPPVEFAPLPPGVTLHYNLAVHPGIVGKLSFSTGLGVPIERAARADVIGQDGNVGLQLGPAFLSITGGIISIDLYHFRQVIFNGVEIHYSGKPVILENVLFINCKFVVDNDERGRQFAGQVLATAHVTWQAKG